MEKLYGAAKKAHEKKMAKGKSKSSPKKHTRRGYDSNYPFAV